MLSVDFVREGKAAPKERGQYFGLNAAEASARLGAPNPHPNPNPNSHPKPHPKPSP